MPLRGYYALDMTHFRPIGLTSPANVAFVDRLGCCDEIVVYGRRNDEWGPGVAMTKAITASAQVAHKVRDEMTVEWTRDMQELATLWVKLLDNKVSPNQGLMVSPG